MPKNLSVNGTNLSQDDTVMEQTVVEFVRNFL